MYMGIDTGIGTGVGIFWVQLRKKELVVSAAHFPNFTLLSLKSMHLCGPGFLFELDW